jgi:hypothetical protein
VEERFPLSLFSLTFKPRFAQAPVEPNNRVKSFMGFCQCNQIKDGVRCGGLQTVSDGIANTSGLQRNTSWRGSNTVQRVRPGTGTLTTRACLPTSTFDTVVHLGMPSARPPMGRDGLLRSSGKRQRSRRRV